ncbi:MAG: 30S ribosomal protein S16 [Patescibacteria group bacterium]
MLMIRLQRVGKKKQAYFRLVLTEHTKKPQGEYQELLGTYDPHAKKLATQQERIAYWLTKGAIVSATANNLLVNHKIIDREKVQSWKPKKKTATA